MRTASPSTSRGAAASSTRCSARRAGSVPARSSPAAIPTRAPTGRSARSAPAWAPPTSPRAWPSASSGRRCPATIRVEFTGEKRRFVTGKDLILAVIDEIGVGGATNAVLEFVGAGRRRCRSTSGWPWPTWPSRPARRPACSPPTRRPRRTWTGATERRGRRSARIPTREFARERPCRSGRAAAARSRSRTSPGNVAPVGDVAGHEDRPGLHRQLRERHDDRPAPDGRDPPRAPVHRDCRMIVVPATQRIYREALAEGLLDLFVEAGAMVSTPTCGACFGGGMGVLGAGERAIATTNRNFRGRMGSRDAEVHLANAYVAAAAAVAGEIVDPAELAARDHRGTRGGDRRRQRRHRRDVPRRVPQHRRPRRDEGAPVRGRRPGAPRRAGRPTRSSSPAGTSASAPRASTCRWP